MLETENMNVSERAVTKQEKNTLNIKYVGRFRIASDVLKAQQSAVRS